MKEEVLERIIEFASVDERIMGLTKGCHVEEKDYTVFYLLPRKVEYDAELSDTVCDLELEIFHKYGENVSVMCWPIRPENVGDYGFLGEVVYQE